jgi:hypothetical protein
MEQQSVSVRVRRWCVERALTNPHSTEEYEADDSDITVKTYEDLTLLLAYESEQPDSPFCCNKPYNTETQACEVSSRGSFQPFQLPIGRIVYNRTDGLVMTNGTLPSSLFQQKSCEAQTASSTQNQTIQTLEPTTCPQITAQAQSTNVTAIAAGVAAPLGVLFLASLVAVAVLFVQNRSLKRLARHPPLAHGLPAAQAGNDGWQGAHVRSPAKEMSSEGAAIESGGRPAAQELPARGLGD